VKGIKDSVRGGTWNVLLSFSYLTTLSLSLCFSVSARYMAMRIPVKPGFRIHMTHKQLAPQEQEQEELGPNPSLALVGQTVGIRTRRR
jgi:hypothetical protein